MDIFTTRRTSKTFETLITEPEDTKVMSTEDQQAKSFQVIDTVIESALSELKQIDPKFNFAIRNISAVESENFHLRQYHYFLIWKELSKPNVCRITHDDGYFATIELLREPLSWSAYDIATHLIRLGRRRYLNGLTLRDDFVKLLTEILKSDEFSRIHDTVHFIKLEFEPSTIRLYFTAKILMNHGSDGLTFDQPSSIDHKLSITYVININTLIEFNNPSLMLFKRMKDSLGQHQIFHDYFDTKFEPKSYLISHNSFKWTFDTVYTEHLIFQHIAEQKCPIALCYKKLMSIRKTWKRYFQKVYKLVENIKINDSRKISVANGGFPAIKPSRITTSQGFIPKSDFSLSSQLEAAIERTFTQCMFQALFLRHCAKHQALPENRDTLNSVIIGGVLDEMCENFTNKYCESFMFKFKNIMPKCALSFEHSVNTGVERVMKEIRWDWNRGRFGH